MSLRAIGLVAGAALVAGLLGSAELTLARFRDAGTATATFTTATLRPPTDLEGTGGAVASLTWTPSTSGWATGYQVLRSATSGSGYDQVGDVTPVGASAATDSPAGGTWYYVLRTSLHSWTSIRSNEAAVTVGSAPTNTGFKDCANNVADTGGDGNGFQTTPANGCVEDGNTARDPNSGTTTSGECLDVGKDRHRFWGYAFGLPPSVTSIDGITIRARMGTSNANGTYGACVQLSWDGGASWTTHQSIMFATRAQTTYTFGGASDTWGRAWSSGQLDTTSFRVRIINVATVSNKRFDLDWIGVDVAYTP